MRNPKASIRPLLVLLICVFAVLSGAVSAEVCQPGRVDLRGDWGHAAFAVEIADTPAERSRGLMFREEMAAGAGMIFVYEHPQPVSFWMKNTRIPLDMIFADETGRVRHVHSNAIPGDLTPIHGGEGIFAVLEINGGLAARLGIEAGDLMRHPAFDPSGALWPC